MTIIKWYQWQGRRASKVGQWKVVRRIEGRSEVGRRRDGWEVRGRCGDEMKSVGEGWEAEGGSVGFNHQDVINLAWADQWRQSMAINSEAGIMGNGGGRRSGQGDNEWLNNQKVSSEEAMTTGKSTVNSNQEARKGQS